VLEATGIVEIDFTAAQILRDLIRRCHADGVDFAIARLESIRAQAAMARFGINDLLGPDHSFRSVEEAIQALGKKPGREAPKEGPEEPPQEAPQG
jgi:MFS superfamily sulfate permease-like transporter